MTPEQARHEEIGEVLAELGEHATLTTATGARAVYGVYVAVAEVDDRDGQAHDGAPPAFQLATVDASDVAVGDRLDRTATLFAVANTYDVTGVETGADGLTTLRLRAL